MDVQDTRTSSRKINRTISAPTMSNSKTAIVNEVQLPVDHPFMFQGSVFYLDLPKGNQNVYKIINILLSLGAKIEKYFNGATVTHVLTNRNVDDIKPVAYKPVFVPYLYLYLPLTG